MSYTIHLVTVHLYLNWCRGSPFTSRQLRVLETTDTNDFVVIVSMCHHLTMITQHNRLICVFKEFFSVFWTDRGRRCTFYRFSVVLLVIRFCKSVTKGQCFFVSMCHHLTMITQHNRLICVFKEFFSVFWTNKIVGTVLHCFWNFCPFFLQVSLFNNH